VITGFNTDVEFNGVTYHVQTEDKGLDTPLILSLVYDRGTILASKRSPYNDLLLGKFNENELTERLQRQHKLICAAIRAGRLDDLKRMNSSKQTAQKTETAAPNVIAKQPAFVVEKEVEIKPQAEFKFPVEQTLNPAVTTENHRSEIGLIESPAPVQPPPKVLEPIQKPNIELPKPEPKAEKVKVITDTPIEITDADLIFDESERIADTQELIIVPEEAVEIVTDFFESETASPDQLSVQLMNEVNFNSGDNKTISVLVSRGKNENALIGANVLVKVLGTSFRPLIFHTKTDSNGVAIVHLQLPHFTRGRAAVLIKAMNNGDEAEIRRVIQPN
jgi:hypothetical protein